MAAPAPIVIDPSPVADQIKAGIRNVIVLIGGMAAIFGFIGRHDAAGLVVYLQSGTFLPVIGAAGTVGAVVWGQWKARHSKAQLVTTGAAAPNSVAIVKDSK